MEWPLEYTHTLQETGLRTRPHRQLVFTSENNRGQKETNRRQWSGHEAQKEEGPLLNSYTVPVTEDTNVQIVAAQHCAYG